MQILGAVVAFPPLTVAIFPGTPPIGGGKVSGFS